MKKLLIALIVASALLVGCGSDKSVKATEEATGNAVSTENTNDEEEVPTQTGIVEPGKDFVVDAFTFTCLGTKEYKKLKSEAYTDKPEKGMVYLVLFVQIDNQSDKSLYFSPNGLTAEVDGEAIEHTFLVNDPEEYETIFTNMDAQTIHQGFIVWQVPENWSKLTYSYTGLEFSNHLSFSGTLNKDTLKNPPKPDTD